MPRLADIFKEGTGGAFVDVHQPLGVHTNPFEVIEHEHSLVGLAENCMYVEVPLETRTDGYPKQLCKFHL